MTSTALPPLTKAQQERVKLFRRQYKSYGKVSVVRKGQKLGHILITATYQGNLHRFIYGPDGKLTMKWIESGLFDETVGRAMVNPQVTNPFTEE